MEKWELIYLRVVLFFLFLSLAFAPTFVPSPTFLPFHFRREGFLSFIRFRLIKSICQFIYKTLQNYSWAQPRNLSILHIRKSRVPINIFIIAVAFLLRNGPRFFYRKHLSYLCRASYDLSNALSNSIALAHSLFFHPSAFVRDFNVTNASQPLMRKETLRTRTSIQFSSPLETSRETLSHFVHRVSTTGQSNELIQRYQCVSSKTWESSSVF